MSVSLFVWTTIKFTTFTKFDTYPMPQIDKLLDQLGAAHFYLAKDLNKVEDFLDSDNLEKIT